MWKKEKGTRERVMEIMCVNAGEINWRKMEGRGNRN